MDEVGSVEIVIKGGRPWGFTLRGGIESKCALTVAEIEPKGKADRQGSLKVGDHVLKINDVQCFSLADATQLIDCAFRTLTVLVWRSKSVVGNSSGPLCESVRASTPRRNRSLPKDDGAVVRRTSAASSKILPKVVNKYLRFSRPHFSGIEQRHEPNVTLTCDSHESRSESERAESDASYSYCGSQSVSSSVDRRSSNSSFSSTTGNQQDVFQTSDVSATRPSRSPRNLTKDSGYETSAQGDHDYVNVDWVNCPDFDNRLSSFQLSADNAVPNQNYYTTSPYSSSEERYDNFFKYGVQSSCQSPYEQNSFPGYDSVEISYNVYYKESAFRPRPLVVPVSKRAGSYSSLCSSSESLSSQPNKPDGKSLRNAKSSLSLVDDKSRYKNQVPPYDQQITSSCQYFTASVTPAKSTPNLHYQGEMVPPRIQKKHSIYEELACKSGFDFSPMVQRQPFWTQKSVLKSNSFSKNIYPKPYSPPEESQQPHSLPANCDKFKSQFESLSSCYSNVSENFKLPNEVDEYPSLPPPVPARDSSLRCRPNTAHEKYPSWPANLSPEEANKNSVQAGGQRSSSWTEQTRRSKESNGGAYSRPKSHFQISNQHLPPVQEKTNNCAAKPSHVNNGSVSDSVLGNVYRRSDALSDLSPTKFNAESFMQRQNEVSYTNKHSYAHSPPERDVMSSSDVKISNSPSDNYPGFRSAYRPPDSKNFKSYENCQINNNSKVRTNNCSTTPLLDKLRLEKSSCVSLLMPHGKDRSCSDAGICSGESDSSSEETLKWHGSCSDISSLNTCKRNASPTAESECSTIYDELNVGSVDSSVKSYSSSPSENSSMDVTNHCQHHNSGHPSVQDERNATEDILKKRFQQAKHRRHSSRSRSDSAHSNGSSSSVEESLYVNTAFIRKPSYTIYHEDSNKVRPLPLPGDGWNKDPIAPKIPEKPVKDGACSTATTQNSSSLGDSSMNPRSFASSENRDDYSSKLTPYCRPSQSKQESLAKKVYQGNVLEKSPLSWELKAIQKQAVLSFYHRQTASASKDPVDKKAPRSLSFTYARDNAGATDSVSCATTPPSLSPTAHSERKRYLSSSSFSPPPTAHDCGSGYVQSSVSAIMDSADKNEQLDKRSLRQSVDSLPSSPSESQENMNIVQRLIERSSDESQAVDGATCNVVQLNKDLIEQVSLTNGETEKFQKTHAPGRKALLKKIYNQNESAVVKVISSQGETLAKSVIEPRNRQDIVPVVVKPQVPPKRIQSDDVSVVLPVQDSSSSPSVGNAADEEEDEELRMLEKSRRVPLSPRISEEEVVQLLRSPSASVMSCSPDLPLPPLPHSNETEVLPTDDPFPPPPDFLEFSVLETSKVAGFPQENGFRRHSRFDAYSVERPRLPEIVPIHSLRSQNSSSSYSLAEVRAVDGNQNQAEFRPSYTDSSPLFPAAPATDAVETAKQTAESEAIYVNLDFRNRLYQKLMNEKEPKSVNSTHATISVTNTATQTSDSTPSLQRKSMAFKKPEERFESTRSCIPDILGRKTSLIVPVSSSSAICKEVNSDVEKNGRIPYFKEPLLNQSRPFPSEICSMGKEGSQMDGICLPLTSPYFTTSEPKAKLLTRYCQSFEKEWANQLELKGQKEVLVESISKKLNILRLEQVELKEEMRQNEELGQEVTARIEKLAKPNELQKYKVHVEELEKIIKLLMSLSGRLARAENALLVLPENANAEEKSFLEAKRNKLSQQHDEAWHLKENIDRRSCQVSYFLHQYLSKEEYADYEHFIKMKSKLLMDAIEVDEKIKLGEEQLAALQGTFQAQQGKIEKVNSAENPTVLGEI